MSSAAVALLLLAAVFVFGCTTPQEKATTQSSSLQEIGDSQQEIAVLDSEIQELEQLLADSEYSEEDFLALDNGTFQ